MVMPCGFESHLSHQKLGYPLRDGPILLFDTGGAFETSTIAYWIFKNVDSGVYEYPASVGFFFTLVSIPIVFLFRWLINKIDPDVEY